MEDEIEARHPVSAGSEAQREQATLLIANKSSWLLQARHACVETSSRILLVRHTLRSTICVTPCEREKDLRVSFNQAPTDVEYDAVIVGGGMGGLTTATQMVAKGAKVLVLEK